MQGESMEVDDVSASDTLAISVNESVNSGNIQALADHYLPSPGHTPGPDGENPRARESLEKDRKLPERVLQDRYAKWIQSMPKWQHGLGEGWVGRRVLGRGGNGIAGLWEYIGDPREKQSLDEWLDPNLIVVKQQRASYGTGLKKEAATMKALNTTGTRHVPKLYKRCYREPGAGTPGMRIDSSRREVHRIFMEFCPGGDMWQFIDDLRHRSPSTFLREDKVWAIFVCLAKALMAIEHGTEDLQYFHKYGDSLWAFRRSVHFDLKPDNIFIGKKDPVDITHCTSHGFGEHHQMPVFKVGDFGMMTKVPKVDEQDLKYVDKRAGWGTRTYLAPEQQRFSYFFDRGVKTTNGPLPSEQRKYGSHTNVYQIGCVMYCLMTLYPNFPRRSRTFRAYLTERLRKGETIGEALIAGVFDPRVPRVREGDREGLVQVNSQTGDLPDRLDHPYSRDLCALVLECLMQDYRNRPGVAEILERAEDCYKLAAGQFPEDDDAAASMIDNFLTGTAPLEEPTPPRWKSSTDLNDWRALADDKHKYMHYRPLSLVLRRQEHDRKRFNQVRKAREMLNWRQPPAVKKAQSIAGLKRLWVEDAENSEDDAEEEEESFQAQGAIIGTSRRAMPPPPIPRKWATRRPHYNLDRLGKIATVAAKPATKRQRPNPPGEDIYFLLTIQVHGSQFNPVIVSSRTVEFKIADTILFLKECLASANVAPWGIDHFRIARRCSRPGDLGYDLPDDMWASDAAEAHRMPGQALAFGILNVYERSLHDDVEMGY